MQNMINTTLVYNGQEINQRSDGYVNATQMAKVNNFRLDHWFDNSSTQEYLKALVESIPPSLGDIVGVSGFGNNKSTWMHPLAAIYLAQCISPEFHVWCNAHIKTLVESGTTSITPALPETDDDRMLMLAASVTKLIGEKRMLQAENEVLLVKVAQAKDAVEFVNQVEKADKNYDMKTTANMLGLGRNTLIAVLRANRILTGTLAYQTYQTRGYFVIGMKADGIEYSLSTAKGIQWLQKKLPVFINKYERLSGKKAKVSKA
jgi:phage antirepressor YoqD-like protein